MLIQAVFVIVICLGAKVEMHKEWLYHCEDHGKIKIQYSLAV